MRNLFQLFLLIVALALFATGCAILEPASDRAAARLGDGITYYCENVDASMREQFRARVNAHAAPPCGARRLRQR